MKNHQLVNLRPITSYDEYDNPVETGTDIFRMKMTGVAAWEVFFLVEGKGCDGVFFLCGKSVESWVLNVLSLLFGITYIVGKIKFKLLFQGPLAK